VPGLRLDSGERLAGSRAIMRRLDELAPDPALYPAAGGEARKLAERAEEWGDEVLQPLVRRLAWADASTRSDLLALVGHLDRVDRWVGDGLLGGTEPNAADLQIGACLQLALTLDDLRPLIDGRPGARLAAFLAPIPGAAPAVLPAGWLPG
jgi:glutathione S-transferase